MIYESLEYYNDKTTGEQKEAHNVVFLGRDKEGTAKQANKRSIATYGKSFRMTVSGSDTNFSFCHIGTDDMILVFEAPIDMLSFITLYPADWQKHSYIALDGISERSLLQALSDYPHLQHVVLCTDNDEGGIDAAERIRDILYSKGYQHIGRATSQAKDWNEDLKHNYGEEYIPANVHPLKNAVANVVDEIEPQNDTLSPGFEDLLAEGLYTDMVAIRRDEDTDNIHSIYVDQWDWEKIITKEERNLETLKETVRTVYKVLRKTEKYMSIHYDYIEEILPHDIFFVTTSELAEMFPDYSPKEREYYIAKAKGAVCIMQIGETLENGKPHDGRAPDYDDWALNADIVVYYPVLDIALELSSMGIRVDKKALLDQLQKAGCPERAELPYHKAVIGGELPLTIGGGIGQSRICMFFLRRAHIGEVQSSIWPADIRKEAKKHNITLL